MFRKILAGTDGSDTAMLALGHAAHLAQRLGAQLTVVTAHERAGAGKGPGDTGRVIAGALLRDVEAAFGGAIRLETRAAAGSAADVLVDLAEQEGFDLVVVGNRGLSGGSSLQPASIPGRVTRRAPAVGLVVDTVGGRKPRYPRILAGTDASSTAAPSIQAAAQLTAPLEADPESATVV